MPQVIDLTGQRFGMLLVLREQGRIEGRAAWLTRCDCGTEKVLRGYVLRRGQQNSCGCAWRRLISEAKRVHGMSNTRTWNSWKAMRERCLNPTCKDYPRWGGAGIHICERWDSFENFYADMGDRPPKTTLDRIDGTGHYEPNNCRWATDLTQARNRKNVARIEFDGRALLIHEWAGIASVSPSCLRRRLEKGWDMARAMSAPLHELPKKPKITRSSKRCSKCKQQREASAFGSKRSALDGLMSQCRACIKERDRARNQIRSASGYYRTDAERARWQRKKERRAEGLAQ